MLDYYEFEKKVYNWFLNKHNNNNSFTFSVRRKASKGAQSDYFIGTQKSKYFSTTLWSIPVGYPGSSSDLIDIVFLYDEDNNVKYHIEFKQTKSPHDSQNKSAINLIVNIKEKIKNLFDMGYESKISNKIETYKTKSFSINYLNIDELFKRLEKDLELIVPIIEKGIEEEQQNNQSFIAHRISNKKYEDMHTKLTNRQKKYRNNDDIHIENKTMQDMEEDLTTKFNNKIFPLNQILFGPPGTGKTFNTINIALEIIGENIEGKTRQEIKDIFDMKMNEKQIMFTSFHQSLSYEDFIEGIKPVEPEKEGGRVIYRIEHGVFRNICIEASFAIAQLRETKSTEKVLDFSILYDQFLERVEEKLLNGEQVELVTKSGGTVTVENISQQGNFIIKHINGSRTYTVSKSRLTKLQSVIKNLKDVTNISNQFKNIIGGSNSSAYWSVLNAIKKEKQGKITNKIFKNYSTDDKKSVVLSLSKSDYKNINNNFKPFVLIIDEINRGNVSQVFGELISLIEEDKRLGKEESLEATLPYSKEKFGVPPNLYIIGTMNTADRSIEALDAALRRRFSFEEMPPRYDLVELDYKYAGIEAHKLLKTINIRIEKLLDKDHKIGHSYFILNGEKHVEDKLITSFYNNIIPLLQEYFFGDFGKIGLVLGDGFVTLKEWSISENSFADFNQESASDFEDRPVYEIIDYRIAKHNDELKNKNKQDVEMTFEKAIKRLMKQDIE